MRKELQGECANLKRQLQVDGTVDANELVMQMQTLSALHEDILRMLKVEYQSALTKVESEQAHFRFSMCYLQRQLVSSKRTLEFRTRLRAPLGSLAHINRNVKKRRVEIRTLLNPWEMEET